jgi:hypothetical protein
MHILASDPAPAALPADVSPEILAAFRAAGVTAQDVTPFAACRPGFAVYAPLLEATP